MTLRFRSTFASKHISNDTRICFFLRHCKDVILCAGVFGSPQALMLSGIGDPNKLAKVDIECKHSLPGVGENLQDHVGIF